MRKVFSKYIALLCLMLVPLAVQARKSTLNKLEHHDFIYLAPAVGFHSLIDTTSSPSLADERPLGGAVQLGAGYRMYHDHFLFQAGLNLHVGADRVAGNDLTATIAGLGNVNITSHYDRILMGEVQIPVQIGAEVGRFYFLVGPKVGFHVYSSSKPYAMATTVDGNAPVNVVQNATSEAFSYVYNLNAAAEIGWRLGEFFTAHGADVPQPSTRYYLGVFAEGGALSRTISDGHDPFYESATVTQDGKTLPAVGLYPLYGLSDFKNTQFIHNYTVGVKLTVLFELNTGKNCVVCRDHRRADFSW